MEALPHVLRIHHDLPHPDLKLSPYQLLFGRERSLAGLPIHIKKECPAAKEFLSHIGNVDFWVSKELNELHDKQQENINKRRPRILEFIVY